MAESSSPPGLLTRFASGTLRVVAALLLTGFAAWSELAILFHAPVPATPRLVVATVVALLFLLTALTVLIRRGLKWTFPAAFLVAAVLIVWWGSIKPSQDRDWQPDVSRRSVMTVRGDDLEVSNVRVFDWNGADTANPRWEDRIYSLHDLRSLDLFTSTWGNDNIAHTMLSFTFGNGPPLVLSIEIRKEKGEAFSAIAGFFKKYELILIAADESDIVKVRTNYRSETVHRFRIDVKPENAEKLLMKYVELSQSLDQVPRFYDTLWTNCTTTIFSMLRAIGPDDFPFDYRVLISGRVAEYLYGIGFIENVQPFTEVRRRADITMKARLAATDPQFSQAIRK